MTASTSFAALGGVATVAVAEPPALERALAEVAATIEQFDRACSRFRPDSELSRVNRAGGAPVKIGALLAQAVAAALEAAALTEGAVDPTVGAALMALGYDRDLSELRGGPPPSAPRQRVLARAVPGWRTVSLDPEVGTIRLPAGARLDLGATAKALAADHAAERAAAATGSGVLVSLSGDLGLAGPPPPEGWLVRVTDDHRSGPEAAGQTLTLWDGGLATSSTQACRWPTSGGTAHHLVDPRSGLPVRERWRTVSVAAASCLQANVASTAAMVQGDGAVRWLEAHRLPARLVAPAGTALHLGGWPAQGEELPHRGLAEASV